MTDLQIRRQGHVDLLSIWSDSIEQKGVVQRAVPHRLKTIESPEGENQSLQLIDSCCFLFFKVSALQTTEFVGSL